MSKKFKQFISLALSLTLLFTLAACGGSATPTTSEGKSTSEGTTTTKTEESTTEGSEGSETSSEEPGEDYGDTGGLKLPVVDSPVDITWVVASPVENLTDKQIPQEISKRTGVNLIIESYPEASYPEKVKSMIGSGSVPDIFTGALSLAELNEYGEQGAFAKINEYYDQLPNFKRLYVDNPDHNWITYSFSSDAGNIYLWPIYNLSRDVNHGIMYRSDVFEDLGIEPWTDTDSFYENLKALKEAYPDSYPFGSKNGEGIFRTMAGYWGIGAGSYYPFHYADSEGVWKFGGADENFKEMLDFMKKLYDEGLLDPEFLTDTQDSWSAKVTTDKNFIFYDWIGRLSLFTTQMAETDPEWNLTYGYPIGSTGKHLTLDKVAGWGPTVAAGAKEEAALKMLDYMTSPSGSELFTIGIEGETFEWEDGKPVYPELKDEPLIDINLLMDRYGMWVEGMYVNSDSRSVYFNYTEEEQKAQDLIVENDLFNPLEPAIKLNEEEASTFTEINTVLAADLLTFASNYVMNDADWDAFVAQSESKGYKTVEEILNAAQSRMDEFFNN